jgi:hypothetical protein
MDYYHIHITHIFSLWGIREGTAKKTVTTYINMFKLAELVLFSHKECFGGNVETTTIIQYHNVLWGQVKSDGVLYFCIKLKFSTSGFISQFLMLLVRTILIYFNSLKLHASV